MGGVIGLLADEVGKKLGKKRLSIGGLRPRQTARLGTFLLGVSISIFTQLSVLGFSSGVREWVLKGPQVAMKLRQATEQLNSIEKQVDETQSQNLNLKNQNGLISRDLKARQADLVKANSSLSDLQNKINALQPRIRVLTSMVEKGNSKIAALNQAKQQGELNLAKVMGDLRVAGDRYNNKVNDNNNISVRNLELTQKNDTLNSEQNRLLAEQKRLNIELNRLERETTKATEARDRIQQELTESQQRLVASQKRLTAVTADLARTEAELQTSNIRVSGWREISAVARRESLIYRIGEEIARVPVRSHLNTNAARSELTSLIRKARVEAQKRGAHSTTEFPAAGIFNHLDSQTQQTIPAAMIEGQIVSQISGSKSDLVMIAASSLNAFRGEPVSLEITVLPNPAVYSAGQIISETVIDANRGDSTISEEFAKFLQVGIRERAIKDGMIPFANSDKSFGELTLSEVLGVIEKLRKADRKVRLQAISIGNIRAADELKLEFHLR